MKGFEDTACLPDARTLGDTGDYSQTCQYEECEHTRHDTACIPNIRTIGDAGDSTHTCKKEGYENTGQHTAPIQ